MGLQPRNGASLFRLRLRLLFRQCYPQFKPRGRALRRPLTLVSMIFVISIIATGFYLVVPLTLIPQFQSDPWHASMLLLLFFWSISCTIISYLLTAISHPGRVPDTWKPTKWQQEEPQNPGIPIAQHVTSDSPHSSEANSGFLHQTNMYPVPPPAVHAAGTGMLRADGRHRFCVHCNVFKPDRAHHCSSCQECVLAMDHHCPFTGDSCIGYLNRKFFVLFLYYATFSCILVAVITPGTIWTRLIDLEEEPSSSAIVGVVLLMMGYCMCSLHALALTPFSMFHTYLVLKNRTTIENQEVRPALHSDVLHKSDRSWLNNWKAVFGPTPLLWFVPVTFGRERHVVELSTRQADELV